MKKRFLIKILSIIFTIGLINSSPVLAKVEQNAQQQEKKLSKEEEKKQDIATINEALKKIDSLEEQMQKEVKKKFENFKEEDFEVKNYNLEVFKKGDAYFLIYTHKKTGAYVFFNLVLDKEKLKKRIDSLIFKAPTNDDKGLMHFLEHCIATPFIDYFKKKLQSNLLDVNANTTIQQINFISRVGVFGLNEKLEKEYVERLAKELNNPAAFKKGDKTFEIQKKRILNELKDDLMEDYKYAENLFKANSRDYTPGGKVSEVEKVTLKDLKIYYKEYIHPSNCLLIKNVFELNPKTIEKYLNMWHENYFKHYNKKKIKGNNYKKRNEKKYLHNIFSKDSSFFNSFSKKTNKKRNFKYFASLYINEENFNFKQKQSLFLNLDFFKKEIKNFTKSLGYDKCHVKGKMIDFKGNKKELFKKEALEKNYKKIMEFIANKLKNLNEKEWFYFLNYHLKDLNKFEIETMNLKDAYLNSDPEIYLDTVMSYQINTSFLETGKPFSEKFFIVNKNNELTYSTKIANKYAKENINVYNELAKKGPQYINLFERGDKTFKQIFKKQKDRFEVLNRVLPIKLKNENSNKFVNDFAAQLLTNALNIELNSKKGLIYSKLLSSTKLEKNFITTFKLNKDSVKTLEDYFVKNFNQIIKNINIKEKDLIELKKRYKENLKIFKKDFEDSFKNEKKLLKDLKNYVETKKVNEFSILHKRKDDLLIRNLIMYSNDFKQTFLDDNLFTLFKNYEDYKDFFEKQMSFKEKYAKKTREKVTPEIAKDFLENFLKPYCKKVEKAYKLAKEKLKALNSIKFKDVKNLIKTAYLVENKNEIEKVNKNIEKNAKRIEKFQENFTKN